MILGSFNSPGIRLPGWRAANFFASPKSTALHSFPDWLKNDPHFQPRTMSRTRRTRLITALFALVSLLFMQWAVASYACPGTASRLGEITAMTEAGMPCAASMSLDMDDAQASLCHAHCQTDRQNTHNPECAAPLAVAALAPSFLVAVSEPASSGGAPRQSPHLKRTTAPPLAISNCCFRL